MILIVDDNDSIREMQAAVLTSANYPVQTAASGLEALQLVSQSCPKLVMLDVTMPGMTGYQVLEKLREMYGEALPIIMVSALSEEEERDRAISYGATDYISKPYNIPSVLNCVKRFMPGTAT